MPSILSIAAIKQAGNKLIISWENGNERLRGEVVDEIRAMQKERAIAVVIYVVRGLSADDAEDFAHEFGSPRF